MCSTEEPKNPPRLWRNGMDFVPKKTYPPDYSNVPSVRDWQMSPFSQERFDLNEIQIAEKKGFKGRFELARLKKLYYPSGKDDECSNLPPECEKCAERDKKKQEKKLKKLKCSNEYLYQPYGPIAMPSLSYSKPESNKPRLYSNLGPSYYAGFRFKTPAPEMVTPIPCPLDVTCTRNALENVYIPYGPYGEVRITPDMYTPMGPSSCPLL